MVALRVDSDPHATAPRPGRVEDLISPCNLVLPTTPAAMSGLKAGGNFLGDVDSCGPLTSGRAGPAFRLPLLFRIVFVLTGLGLELGCCGLAWAEL